MSKTPFVTIVALVLVTLGGLGSCVEVNGGAVELSWALRDFSGGPNSCVDARIDKVRICWQSLDNTDGGATLDLECRDQKSFGCTANRGVSAFRVTPGRTRFFARPLCSNGVEPSEPGYQAPPPIVRNVTQGGVVTLNQLLIVAGNCRTGDATSCACP